MQGWLLTTMEQLWEAKEMINWAVARFDEVDALARQSTRAPIGAR